MSGVEFGRSARKRAAPFDHTKKSGSCTATLVWLVAQYDVDMDIVVMRRFCSRRVVLADFPVWAQGAWLGLASLTAWHRMCGPVWIAWCSLLVLSDCSTFPSCLPINLTWRSS
jgi:hypothetical protein